MTAGTAPDIFLSYSRQDAAVAGKMAAALIAAGHDVWWDQALKAGEVYDKVTEAALLEARLVVVLWSSASVGSDWVRSEATVALQRGALVPVMIEDCRRPVMFELRQSADLVGWKGAAKDPRVVAFLADVARQLGAPTTTKAAPVPATAPKPGPDRRMLIGGAAGVAALAAGGFGAWKSMGGGKADDGTASVVVLPFANLSSDPEQAFFSDGIAEELRNALSLIPGLKVIGRVSSEKFRDTDDLPAAAAKLGVDHVLTGSVRRSPTTIRIGAQLVDGRTGVESWSQSYDQPVGDALAIQSKIATNVVAALSAKLGKAAGAIVVGGTDDANAQLLFLKAQALIYGDRSQAAVQEASALLEAAIARDPDYADAWAGLGDAKLTMRFYATSAAERNLLWDQGLVAARRAVALAPNSGFALVLLAYRWLEMLDLRRAFADGRRAIALAPADARVLRVFTAIQGRFDPDKALSGTRRVVALDPFNSANREVLAAALGYARQFEEAAEVARQAMALSNNTRGSYQLFPALWAMNRVDEARATLRHIPFEVQRLTFEALVEARAGRRAAADAALAALRRRDDASRNYRIATVHVERGETQAALAALEESLRRKEPILSQIAVEIWFDRIRNEPRFKAVQEAVIPPDLFVRPKRWPA